MLDLFQIKYLLFSIGLALLLGAAYVPCPGGRGKGKAEHIPWFIAVGGVRLCPGSSPAPLRLQHACGESNGLICIWWNAAWSSIAIAHVLMKSLN